MKNKLILIISVWILALTGCDYSAYDLPSPDGRLNGVTVDLTYVDPETGEIQTNIFEDYYNSDDIVKITLKSSKAIEKIEVVNSATASVVGSLAVNSTTADFSYEVEKMSIPFGQSSNLVFHIYFNDKGEDGFDYPSMRSYAYTVKQRIPSIVNFKKSDGTVTELRGTDVNIEGYSEDAVKGVVGTFKKGVNSYIDLGSPSSLNFGANKNFSVSFWVKSTHDVSDPAMMGTMDWNSSGNVGWVIAWRNGRIRVVAGDGAGTKTDYRQADEDTPMIDGTWHLVVVTFDRAGVSSLYIDGSLRASAPMVPVNIDAGVSTKINQDGTGNYGDKLGASYAKIVFYDYVVSGSEVTTLFNSGK